MAKPYIVKKIGNGSYVQLNTGQIIPAKQAAAAGLGTGPLSGSKGGGKPITNNPLITATTMPTGNFWDNATPTTRPKGKQTTADVTATQKFLKSKGYNIKVDGVWGPQTQSAALNWRNDRSPETWNRSGNATPSTGFIPTKPSPGAKPSGDGGYIDRSNAGKDTTPAPAKPTPAGKPGPSLYDSLMGLLGGVPKGQLIPLSLAQKYAGGGIDESIIPDPTKDMIDPNQAKSDLAAQYAPLIQEVQNQLGTVPYQTAQDLSDIKHWYDQVKGSVQDASGQVGSLAGALSKQLASNTGAIAASLGGEASPGAGMVAAEGADQANLASQIGSIEQGFLGNMGPILSQEAAAAGERDAARQQALGRDFQNKILELQAQKAQDTSDKLLQIAQYNHGLQQERFQNLMGVKQYNQGQGQQTLQNLLGIIQANQGTRQQNFSNRLALAGFGLSANQLGLSAADTASTIRSRAINDANQTAQVGQQATAQAIQLKQLQAQTAANRAATAGKISQAQTGAYSNAVVGLTKLFGITPDWKVPAGTDPRAVVHALSGQIPGAMTPQKKRLMYAALSQLKTQQGGRLFPDSLLKQWGYA